MKEARDLTLETSALEVFEFVIDRILEQGVKSGQNIAVRGEPGKFEFRCLYRRFDKDEGMVLKCAIGCLILDEDYKEEMEGKGVENLFGISEAEDPRIEQPNLLSDSSVLYKWGLSGNRMSMFAKLQTAHDGIHESANASSAAFRRAFLRRVDTEFRGTLKGNPIPSEDEMWRFLQTKALEYNVTL